MHAACAVLSVWLTLINGDRAALQPPAPPLVVDQDLMWYAQWRSEDMLARDFYGHDIPGIGLVYNVLWALGYGYSPLAENAWWCVPDAGDGCGTQQAHDILMASRAGHREAILNRQATRVGLGAAHDDKDQCVYTQLFASDAPWPRYQDASR